MPHKIIYGLIGNPLQHSFSKQYFENKFVAENIDNARFNNYELERIEDLLPIIQNTTGLQGFAVTKPYKLRIIKYLDEYDKSVTLTQSCNCVLLKNSKLIGFNTDIIGFEKSFTPHLQRHHQQALILGNGGAAQAVKYVLRKLHIPFKLVTRNISKDLYLKYSELNENVLSQHKIIINTTPIGTFPQIYECPHIPYQFVTPQHYLFDLVYNPSITRFMYHGIEHGAFVKSGYQMLCIQAEENWKIWNA